MKKLFLSLIALGSFQFGLSQARVQVIHNSADAAAEVVDVYLDDVLAIDNFAFRTATPFIDFPANVEVVIGIAPPNSSSSNDAIATFPVTLADGETYVVVANGIVSPTGYDPAPAFGLDVYATGREEASNMMNTDILINHGSTDAPMVDLVEVGAGAGTIVDDLGYPEFTGYLELPTADYTIEVRDDSGTVTVASYDAPLATLGLEGQALVAVASGFLNPANNSNGPAFGVYVALASGGALLPLPESQGFARVQVIHNSADAAAEVVDVYLDDVLAIDDFAFRTATPYIDFPSDVEVVIGIAPSNSTSSNDVIASFPVTLASGETYVVVADGIVSPTGYDPAPAFGLEVYAMGREQATDVNNTDVLVHHGSTDAPTVDVYEVGVVFAEIVNDLAYTDFAGYLELPTADYTLQIRDESGTSGVAAFSAPLATLGLDGAALVVVASGFLDPSNNSDGPAFGLWVALPSGGDMVELPSAPLGIEDFNADAFVVYPNPANEMLRIRSMEDGDYSLAIYDMQGRLVLSEDSFNGQTELNVSQLAQGLYNIRVSNGNASVTKRFVKQ